ncbi:MAG TPA: sterol desaturase family protein [Caulobacteraceae bacterium]|jgi:sterol desaturase/sphingolipid hydroxylase (fatty acid hydroxylase superfamily)
MSVAEMPEPGRPVAAQRPAIDGDGWRDALVMIAAVAAYAALSGFGSWLLPHVTAIPWVRQFTGAPAAAPHLAGGAAIAAILVLFIVPGALLLEALSVGWRASSLRQIAKGATASIKTDVAFIALSHVQFTDFAGKLVTLGSSIAAGLWLRGLIARHAAISFDPSQLPLALQVLLYFAGFTFLDYWAHRLYHWGPLWPLHRYHHAATDCTVINAMRAHPAAVLANFIVNLPLAALGASPLVLVYVTTLAQGQSLVIHSRIDSEWGWFGRWVLQSPNHHRMHHKLDLARPTGNFAMAPIWDRLFGTWDGAADPSLVIGVDTPYRHGLWIWPDIWRDFREFCLEATAWRRRA